MTVPVSPKRTALLAAARERILVLDGAMGTMIQALQYDEAAFRGERFRDFHRDLRGNNDLFGRFLGRHLWARRWCARRRIDQTPVLEDFFDLGSIERLVFQQGFRDRFEMVAVRFQALGSM